MEWELIKKVAPTKTYIIILRVVFRLGADVLGECMCTDQQSTETGYGLLE